MLRDSESETEILLGNKQLIAIFCVAVVLLGVAFAGGYKVGQASGKKTAGASVADTATTDTSAPGGETHALTPSGATDTGAGSATTTADNGPSTAAPVPESTPSRVAPPTGEEAAPLGAPKPKASATKSHVPRADTEATTAAPAAVRSSAGEYVPQGGQTFLQVAAVGRDEAEAVADVLRKKGFHAHAVPKPGSAKVYRVLIGPTHDAGDLSATRDSLRRTGFREVIVQHY